MLPRPVKHMEPETLRPCRAPRDDAGEHAKSRSERRNHGERRGHARGPGWQAGEERKWAVALPQNSLRNLPTIRDVAAAANVGPVRCAPKHRGRGANAVPRVGWMPYGTYLSAAQRVRIRPSKESGKRARKKVLGSGKRLAGCGKSTRRPLGAPR